MATMKAKLDGKTEVVRKLAKEKKCLRVLASWHYDEKSETRKLRAFYEAIRGLREEGFSRKEIEEKLFPVAMSQAESYTRKIEREVARYLKGENQLEAGHTQANKNKREMKNAGNGKKG